MADSLCFERVTCRKFTLKYKEEEWHMFVLSNGRVPVPLHVICKDYSKMG
jgi:hypothetical protein